MARRGGFFYRELLPVMVIIGIECIDMGFNTLFKAATLQGLNNHVFVAYSYGVATIVLLPLTLFSRRTREVPQLSFSIISKLGLLGAIGGVSQVLQYAGIDYSSPTLASSICNLIPAFTFILAVTFRMEKLVVNSRSSQAKVIGSLISIAGAFVLTFYKGTPIINAHKHLSLPSDQSIGFLKSKDANWTIGGIMLIADYILVSLTFILQVHILKEFPDELTVVLFSIVTATIISTVVGLLAVPSASEWKVGLNLSLISIISTGIFGKLIAGVVYAWSLRLKGAVFVTSFKPLQFVFSVVMGVMFLGDTLHVGSIIGATIISVGLYVVLWGKVTEEMEEEIGSMESQTTENAPFLQSYIAETLEKKTQGNV